MTTAWHQLSRVYEAYMYEAEADVLPDASGKP